jgi:archaellum component FlaC
MKTYNELGGNKKYQEKFNIKDSITQTKSNIEDIEKRINDLKKYNNPYDDVTPKKKKKNK